MDGMPGEAVGTGTMRDLMEEPSLSSAVLGFYHAVNWQDPFLVAVLSWHAVCILYLVAFWRNTEALLGLWFTQCMRPSGAGALHGC